MSSFYLGPSRKSSLQLLAVFPIPTVLFELNVDASTVHASYNLGATYFHCKFVGA